MRIVSKIILHLKALKNWLHECQSNLVHLQFAVTYIVTNQHGQCAYDVFTKIIMLHFFVNATVNKMHSLVCV